MFASREIEFQSAKIATAAFVALSLILWGFMSFLYGWAYNQAAYISTLPVLVVDLDGGPIGAHLVATAENLTAASSFVPGYVFVKFDDDSEFSDIQTISDAVERGNYWGAVVATPDSSKRLQDAVSAANSTTSPSNAGGAAVAYDPTQACLLIYDEGRNPQVIQSAVLAPMRLLMQQVIRGFGPIFLRTYGSAVPVLLRGAPSLVLAPLAFSENNLHPNTAPVLLLALTFGQVFVMVFGIFSGVFVMTSTKINAATLSLMTIMSLRLRLIIPFWLFLPLWTTILMTIFGVNWPSASAFVSHWFLQVLSMLVYIFVFLSMYSLVHMRAHPLLMAPLFLWVLFNVVGGMAVIELAHPFYRFGYGWVIWNNSAATRYLVYGSYNIIGRNVGIIAGWLVFFFILYVGLQLSGLEREALKSLAKEEMKLLDSSKGVGDSSAEDSTKENFTSDVTNV